MSPIPGNITVTFIANYVGQHRVCYRLGNSGNYSCITTNCITLGTCETQIPIFVDNETCNTVLYTGYVQASCIDPSSSQDRVSWSISFVPTPSCKSYQVTCALLGVESAAVTSGGSGYGFSDIVTTLFGGTGDAHATANIGQGAIVFDHIGATGAGYNNGTYTNVTVTGGTGTGALATVIVSGGIVTSVVITTHGSGYLSTDTLGFNPTDLGESTPSVPATFKAISDAHKIISITGIVNITPYSDQPVVIFAGGTGSGATATATLENCPMIIASGCTGDSVVIAAGDLTGLGQSVNICDYDLPSVDSAYTVSLVGNCLCNCVVATIGISGTVGQQTRYTYNKCGVEVRTGLLTVGGSPSSIIDCIVPGSLVFQSLSSATGTVSYGSACS